MSGFGLVTRGDLVAWEIGDLRSYRKAMDGKEVRQ